MELYIGGRCQGKAAYVLNKKGLSQKHLLEAECLPDASSWLEEQLVTEGLEKPTDFLVLNHLQYLIKKWLTNGKNPIEEIEIIMSHKPDIIIICDEVGNGIVPIDKEERNYRETVGRTLCFLAERAETVERIFCGIGRRIK